MSPVEKRNHEECVELCRDYVRREPKIVAKLQFISKHRTFIKLGKKSLYLYALEECGLSESQSYAFASIAKKANEIQVLNKAIQQEKISVSKAHRIISTINEKNAEELVQFARTHSKDEIEREVRRRNPKAAVKEKIKPLSDRLDELHVAIDRETSEAIRLAQDILAQRRAAHQDLGATLKIVFREWVEMKDPMKKAQRAADRQAKKSSKSQPVERTYNAKNYSARAENFRNDEPLTTAQKHAVDLRDERRCTHKNPDGSRCNDGKWIHYHHIIHRKNGGSNSPDNLTTLCSFHHDMVHQLSFAMEGGMNYLRSRITPYRVQ